MKILVLCVDRDDDIGVKTGIRGPLIGREDNLAAMTKLGLADPEDSDVNAILSAVSAYDELTKKGEDAEVATICGDVRVGATSDLALTRQLDQVLEEVRPDRVFLVSDGAEDEQFSPIVSSRIRVDHVRRVYVRQTPQLESLFYTVGRQLRNPKVQRRVIAPLGFVLLLFGLISLVSPPVASSGIVIFIAVYLLLISLPFSSVREVVERANQYYERVRDSVASGDVSIFFNVSAGILILVGIFFGWDTVTKGQGDSAVVGFLSFTLTAVWWFVLGALLFEGGKVLSAYLRHGRAPRHAFAVAVSFIALGLIVLALIQVFQVFFASYNPSSALPLIALSIGLAVFLVAVGGLSYRARPEPLPEPVEDAWRH